MTDRESFEASINELVWQRPPSPHLPACIVASGLLMLAHWFGLFTWNWLWTLAPLALYVEILTVLTLALAATIVMDWIWSRPRE